MKKKILVVVLGLALCFGMTGCGTSTGSKNYDNHSKLVSIEGENDLYYYATTHIVYIVFNECAGSCTTAVAALNTGRNYICFEKDKDIFEVGSKRVAEYANQDLLISAT